MPKHENKAARGIGIPAQLSRELSVSTLLPVGFVRFGLRVGLWFWLASRSLLGRALFAGLSLRNQEQPRAACQVHVLRGRRDQRTICCSPASLAQRQTVQ